MKKVKFDHNDPVGNGERLAKHFGLARISDVPVNDFTISIDGRPEGNAVLVRDNWYRIALLMLYLVDGQGDKVFDITPSKRAVARNYFGNDVCKLAYDPKCPKTSFRMVRLLLKEGARISVSLEPDH